MSFFCYIECESVKVPYMEPIDADTPETAEAKARMLLRSHASGRVARVFDGDRVIATFGRDEAPPL